MKRMMWAMAGLVSSGALLAAAQDTSLQAGRLATGSPAGGPAAMSIAELAASDSAGAPLRPENVKALRSQLWQKYKAEQTKEPTRIQENTARELRFGSVMRYSVKTMGNKPAQGYPLYIALHGGGGAPPEVNDQGWQHMMIYYLDSVKQGVYVAPRGVTDTWNLHSVADSFPLYDRLIENMILFENVDPNRVYLLGYSAGGDGVYQISPRMADRFAAADMSAGHHNGAGAVNLRNLPFLVQVGERDTAYGRHQATANFALTLAGLQKEYGGGYVHDCFVHLNRGHGVMDRDPAEGPQEVIANPAAWLKDGDRSSRKVNANAVAWVRQYTRDPWPMHVVWDLGMRADRSGVKDTGERLWLTTNRGNLFYWLDVSMAEGGRPEGGVIEATLDKAANAITLKRTASTVRLLLNGDMLNLSKPVTVKIGDETFTAQPRPNLKTMARTLLERGDPNFCFEAEITAEQNGDTWTVK
jgi:poly(3-hydroxybutyrate) depolymerase